MKEIWSEIDKCHYKICTWCEVYTGEVVDVYSRVDEGKLIGKFVLCDRCNRRTSGYVPVVWDWFFDQLLHRKTRDSVLIEDGVMVPNHAATLVSFCHLAALKSGWWTDPETGEKAERNIGELLALIHSEISEALEGYRKGKMDDHLPNRKSIEVELADAVIRICDLAGYLQLNLGGAIQEKVFYNQQRSDHTLEARKGPGGKKF